MKESVMDKSGRSKNKKVAKEIEEYLNLKEERLKEAREQKQTTRHCQLTVTAIEQGFIKYFGMQGKEAEAMKGRSAPQTIKVREEAKENQRHQEVDRNRKNETDEAQKEAGGRGEGKGSCDSKRA